MEKKASIKLGESLVTFDKRKKETKAFGNELLNILSKQIKKVNRKDMKSLLKFAGINVKGRKR